MDRLSFIRSCLPQTARPSLESVNQELEYTFYGKLKDKTQLEKANSVESHDQWDIRFAYDILKGTVRCRKTVIGQEAAKYTLCLKKVVEGVAGRTETETETTDEIFDAIQSMAQSGMRKTRYKFPVPDSELVWEVDIFQDLDGKEIEWVKLDLEVREPLDKLPEFPVELMEVVEPTQRDKIRDLLDNVLTLKPDRSEKKTSSSESYREGLDSTVTSNGKKYQLDILFEKAHRLPTENMEVGKLSWVLDYASDVDHNRIQRSDVSVPLLVTFDDSSNRWIVLDGFHRLNKAINEKQSAVPVKIISAELLAQASIS